MLPWEKVKLLVKVANLDSTEANKNRNNQLEKATDEIDRTVMSCQSRGKRKPNKRSNKEGSLPIFSFFHIPEILI